MKGSLLPHYLPTCTLLKNSARRKVELYRSEMTKFLLTTNRFEGRPRRVLELSRAGKRASFAS